MYRKKRVSLKKNFSSKTYNVNLESNFGSNVAKNLTETLKNFIQCQQIMKKVYIFQNNFSSKPHYGQVECEFEKTADKKP